MEIPTDFSVSMGWVWKLISNSHGSPSHHIIYNAYLAELRRHKLVTVLVNCTRYHCKTAVSLGSCFYNTKCILHIA